jgi:hypothetical protein
VNSDSAAAGASSDPVGQPNEDDRSEIGQRAAYEAELSRITSVDMIMQAAVSLLNIGGQRLGLAPGAEGERDLEQVRDAIDGVRALMGVLERRLPRELGPLRDALSQLQMAYAREAHSDGHRQASASGAQPGGGDAQGGERDAQPSNAPAGPAGQGQPEAPRNAPQGDDKPSGPGPAESSGRLWVPGR